MERIGTFAVKPLTKTCHSTFGISICDIPVQTQEVLFYLSQTAGQYRGSLLSFKFISKIAAPPATIQFRRVQPHENL